MLFSILLLTLVVTQADGAGHVLVFGGNGQLGAQCVEDLLSRGYDVTVAIRGNWYWDTSTSIQPHVKHIKYDRNQQPSPELVEFISNTSLDAIIDFSAFSGQMVAHLADLLRQHPPNIYIYISSDSVDEVIAKKNPDLHSIEEDAVRPTDQALRDSLASRDEYGNGKLEVEEELAAIGVPHVSLRLPDVLGERDNTIRWWLTFLWISLPKGFYRPFQMLDIGNTRLSLVYTKDVSKAILKIIEEPKLYINKAVNFAWSELISPDELYSEIAAILGVELIYEISPEVVTVDYGGSVIPILFPSVTRGPIDVSKAESLGLVTSSKWRDALRDSILFYQNALTDQRFTRERDLVLQNLAKLLNESDQVQLLHTVIKYSKISDVNREEL